MLCREEQMHERQLGLWVWAMYDGWCVWCQTVTWVRRVPFVVFRPGQKQWIQVDLKQRKLISGVITRGSPKSQRWVSKFSVEYYDDNRKTFVPFTEVCGRIGKCARYQL